MTERAASTVLLTARRSRPLVAAGAVVALLIGLGCGSAFGYFTSIGSGRVLAAAAGAEPLSASIGTPTTALLPGSTAGVAVTVTNPNSFPLTITGAVAAGPATADSDHAYCIPTGLSFEDQSALNVVVPAYATRDLELPGAASMAIDSPDACQGAAFAIPLTITARAA